MRNINLMMKNQSRYLSALIIYIYRFVTSFNVVRCLDSTPFLSIHFFSLKSLAFSAFVILSLPPFLHLPHFHFCDGVHPVTCFGSLLMPARCTCLYQISCFFSVCSTLVPSAPIFCFTVSFLTLSTHDILILIASIYCFYLPFVFL